MEHHDDHPGFAISAFSQAGASADELARLARTAHRKIRETTVGKLRAAGYDVKPDEPPEAHALIMLPRLPTDDDYATIASLFDPPRPNPIHQEEGQDG